MLTDNQKSELIKVINECTDDKLKVILCKAIPLWISGKIKPVQKSFGLNLIRDHVYSSCQNQNDLVGTALIGEICSYSHPTWDAVKYFDMNHDEISDIIRTFDNRYYFHQVESVEKIRKILFGE